MDPTSRIQDLSVPCWLLETAGSVGACSPAAAHLGSPLAGGLSAWLEGSSTRRLAALIIRLRESWRPLRFVGRRRSGEPITLLVQRLGRPEAVFLSGLLLPEGDPGYARRDTRRVSVTLRSALHSPVEVAEALVAALEDTAPDYPPARVLLEDGPAVERAGTMGAVLPILGAGERLLGFAEVGGPLPGPIRLERCALLCRMAAARLTMLAPPDLPLLLTRAATHDLEGTSRALSALGDALQSDLEHDEDPARHLGRLREHLGRLSFLLGDLRRLTDRLELPVLTSHSVEEALESAAEICRSSARHRCTGSCLKQLPGELGEMLFPPERAVQILATCLREAAGEQHPCPVELRLTRDSPFGLSLRIEGGGPLQRETFQRLRGEAVTRGFEFQVAGSSGQPTTLLRFPALPLA